jgi:hypothetical protein
VHFFECSIHQNKLRNCLNYAFKHCFWMYVQNFYTLETFPFYTIMCKWNENQVSHAMDA